MYTTTFNISNDVKDEFDKYTNTGRVNNVQYINSVIYKFKFLSACNSSMGEKGILHTITKHIKGICTLPVALEQ